MERRITKLLRVPVRKKPAKKASRKAPTKERGGERVTEQELIAAPQELVAAEG